MSVTVKLYKTSSDREKLSKSLSNEKSYDCLIKETVDVLKPSIRISTSDNISDYNYCYIERYGRYYYIDRIETTPNGYWIVHCTVDPLMSWKNYIKNCNGTITRSETLFNGYLNDSEYKALAYKKIVTKKFPNSINDDCFILMTVG